MTAPRTREASSVILAAVLGVSLFGGSASAYWRTAGTGSGTASTSTIAFTLPAHASTASGSGTLFPDVAGDLLLRYDNPTGRTVRVSGLTAGALPSATTDCKVTLRAPASWTDARYALAPGTGTLTVPGGAHMALDAPSSCQGRTFDLPITMTVRTP